MARRLSNVDGVVTGGYTGGYIPGVVGHPAYYNMQGGLQPRDYPAGAAPVVGDGRFSRKRAPHRSAPWARGRRARVCDHPELGVDAPSAPACIRERSGALPVCGYLR